MAWAENQNALYGITFFLIVLLAFCTFFLFRLEQKRKKSQAVKGKIVYSDLRAVDKSPILSDRSWGLCGKPDQLIQQRDCIIPIEIKSTRAPAKPPLHHVMQLCAYCRLVEQHFGIRPPYGILQYQNRNFQISYTIERETMVRHTIKQIREKRRSGCSPERSHQYANRCANCGYSPVCDEKMEQ